MSFEGFTRPFQWKPVWPPAPARPAVPEDKPEQGVAVLRGLGGRLIDLTMSETSSWSKSRFVEQERVVTQQRIYQKEKKPDGTEEINEENYVDVDVMTEATLVDGYGVPWQVNFANPPVGDNIETIQENIRINNPDAPPPSPPTGEGET